jgi:hypothetical protein
MIATERTIQTKDDLMDLGKMMAALDNRLRSIQWDLQRSTTGLLAERFRSLMRFKKGNRLMSTVCNQHIRSNTKVVGHDDPRT